MNMALVFGIVQVANKFELDKPENTTYLRISYLSVQAIAFAIIGIIYLKIQSKKDTTKLSYQEPKQPFATEEPEIVTTTYCEYDKTQARQLATQTAIGLCISF